MRSGRPGLAMLVIAAPLLLLIAPSLPADEIMRTKYIFDSSTDRTPAKTAFPNYPRIARRDRIEGDAKVCFRIDQRGRIRKPRVREVSHPIFKRASLRAIRASSFEPLRPHQILSTGLTCRTFRFRLEPALAVNSET